jgi:hypothetical protein
MSIDNTFEFTAPGYCLEQVCNAIKNEFSADLKYSLDDGAHIFYSEIIWFRITETMPYVNAMREGSFKEWVLTKHRELYRFTPDYSILFSWNKTDVETFCELESLIMNFIMKTFDGDAYYLFNMDCPRLWRHNGVLYLDSNSNQWVDRNEHVRARKGYDQADFFDGPIKWLEFPEMP